MKLLTNKKVNISKLALTKSTYKKKKLKNFAKKVQEHNDYLIDNFVLNPPEAIMELDDMNTTELKLALIFINNIPISEDYQTLIRDNDLGFLERIRLQQEKEETLENITNKQVTIIQNNLNYVQDVLNTHDIDTQKYRKIVNKNPTINRRELLNLATKNGINQDLLTPYGSYNSNLDILSENLQRKSEIESEHTIMQNNEEVMKKIWVHVPNEHTRHESNDWKTVDINSKFEITNDNTGETDEMEYPHDSNGSFGNICNCYCELAYMDKYGEIV